MRLHVIQTLGSLALLSVTTAAAPTNDDTTAAESNLFSREVACVPSAEKVTCWNDGHGLVPVGSFSFIMAAAVKGYPCQVQLLTQNFPYSGRLYTLKDGATTGCGKDLSSTSSSYSLSAYKPSCRCSLMGKMLTRAFQFRVEPRRSPFDHRIRFLRHRWGTFAW